MNTTSYRRTYVRPVVNGYVVELSDDNYNDTVYVFSNWDDVVSCVHSNAPVFKPVQQPSIDAVQI